MTRKEELTMQNVSEHCHGLCMVTLPFGTLSWTMYGHFTFRNIVMDYVLSLYLSEHCHGLCMVTLPFGTLSWTMYGHFTFLTKSLSRNCSLTAWKSKAIALFSQMGLIRAICFRQANIELDLFTPSSSFSSSLSDGFIQHNRK